MSRKTQRLQGLFIVSSYSVRSANREPWSCGKTVTPTKTRRVDGARSHLEHSYGPTSGWMGERALDSRGGENDEAGAIRHQACLCQHNVYSTPKGLWIPAAARE